VHSEEQQIGRSDGEAIVKHSIGGRLSAFNSSLSSSGGRPAARCTDYERAYIGFHKTFTALRDGEQGPHRRMLSLKPTLAAAQAIGNGDKAV
jgi:hypothetical protein